MKEATIQTAINEAQRFLDRANEALKRHVTDETEHGVTFMDGGYLSPSRESGALRRASLDLTRALAEMRRP